MTNEQEKTSGIDIDIIEFKAWRKRVPLTQGEVARKLRTSQKNVSYWETGARKMSHEMRNKWIEVFHFDPAKAFQKVETIIPSAPNSTTSGLQAGPPHGTQMVITADPISPKAFVEEYWRQNPDGNLDDEQYWRIEQLKLRKGW